MGCQRLRGEAITKYSASSASCADIADAAEPSGVKNGADYINAGLPSMDFSHKNLANANFSNAKLVGANFSGAVLTGAQFTNADLSQANLTGANLTGASFVNAILSGADLSNADFSNANLSNAVMDGALVVDTKFDHAILTNVDMGTVMHRPSPHTELTDAKTIRAALKPDPANPKAPRKIDLTVNFDFNSDRLTVDGAEQVKEIAAALNDSSLQQASIVVEGHTDNIGTDAYNQKLSERRATRLLQTLTSEYHVSVNICPRVVSASLNQLPAMIMIQVALKTDASHWSAPGDRDTPISVFRKRVARRHH